MKNNVLGKGNRERSGFGTPGDELAKWAKGRLLDAGNRLFYFSKGVYGSANSMYMTNRILSII